MKTSDFAYELQTERIAQHPLKHRDQSRLLIFDRNSGHLEHRLFADIGEYLRPGDMLVANDSRVMPARLFGRKTATGGRVELLLLERLAPAHWQVIVGGKGLSQGKAVTLLDRDGRTTSLTAKISAVLDGPLREVIFSQPLDYFLEELGHTPLPPYIHEKLDDPERYQTVYARWSGSAAAPTAGLHFTPDLLIALRQRGVLFETVTLHVGLDTFKPVDVEDVANHTIHSEWARLTPESAKRINEAKLAGGRVVAVGTTTVRTLETAALRSAGINGSLTDISSRDASGETFDMCPWRPVAAFEGHTDLFIYPGYRYRAVDAMITNFHLPYSTLLMLVSAFSGRVRLIEAYHSAIDGDYRFYSFGDAMLIS